MPSRLRNRILTTHVSWCAGAQRSRTQAAGIGGPEKTPRVVEEREDDGDEVLTGLCYDLTLRATRQRKPKKVQQSMSTPTNAQLTAPVRVMLRSGMLEEANFAYQPNAALKGAHFAASPGSALKVQPTAKRFAMSINYHRIASAPPGIAQSVPCSSPCASLGLFEQARRKARPPRTPASAAQLRRKSAAQLSGYVVVFGPISAVRPHRGPKMVEGERR